MSESMSKIFLDTNVLVYALDRRNKSKRLRARRCIAEARKDSRGVISTQVLQEFFVASTKKLSVAPLRLKQMIAWFERHFEIVNVTPPLIRDAIECSVRAKVSFWDALVIVAAESAGAAMLWSEDLNAGQIIRDVQIVNPFTDNSPDASA